MNDDIKINNYVTYKRFLDNLITKENADKVIELLGGDEKVINASFGMSLDSGSAYPGAFVYNSIMIAEYAKKLNELLPESMRVDNKSIYRVALLQHIGKVVMYTENDNEWEVKNRGFAYKFIDQNTALRCGERALFILMQAGVVLTEDEFEAIRIVDKSKEDDSFAKFYSNTLAFIIRQANEFVSTINKQESKQ
jgi:hypothetical protein